MPEGKAANPTRIAALARSQGRQLAWMAKTLGKSRMYIYDIDRGKYRAHPDFIAAAAVLLGVPEHELFLCPPMVTVGTNGHDDDISTGREAAVAVAD